MIINIPFSGFYESAHDDIIQSAIESMFSDYDTGCDVNYDLVALAQYNWNYHQIELDYSKDYVENFSNEFNVQLKFESLSSPKEYNFTTDRIFCHITQKEVKRLYTEVDKQKLKQKAIEMFTSRSGFNSFYDNNYENWGNVLTWDFNQLGCLLEAYIDTEIDDYDIMEDSVGNGVIDEIVAKNIPNINRLYTIHEYLQKRLARNN